MNSSNVPGWVALASFALACGHLVRARFHGEGEESQTALLMDSVIALVASSSLASLPKLFGVENVVFRWGSLGSSAAFMILGAMLLIRCVRLDESAVGE